MVCFRYLIVNTLHKGDKKDDDDSGDDDDDDIDTSNSKQPYWALQTYFALSTNIRLTMFVILATLYTQETGFITGI